MQTPSDENYPSLRVDICLLPITGFRLSPRAFSALFRVDIPTHTTPHPPAWSALTALTDTRTQPIELILPGLGWLKDLKRRNQAYRYPERHSIGPHYDPTISHGGASHLRYFTTSRRLPLS